MQVRDLAPAQPLPYPLKATHICLYNYLTSVHVQSEDGQHQWPKHVVVPNVVNTYYTTNKYSCVRHRHTYHTLLSNLPNDLLAI